MSESRDLGVKQAWATTFFQRVWNAHGAEAPAIIQHIESLCQQQRKSVDSGIAPGAKPARGLYESNFDFFADPHPALQKLVSFIRETLQVSISYLNRGEVPPQQLDVSFPDSWYHVTKDGGFHDAHTHADCSWCGIYYLKLGEYRAPEDRSAPNGGSRFYCPLPTGGRYEDYGTKYLSSHSLDPPLQEGLLILFPSYLFHSGLPYRGTTDRIVIAFNSRIHLH